MQMCKADAKCSVTMKGVEGVGGGGGFLLVKADHLVKDSKFDCLPHLALIVDF